MIAAYLYEFGAADKQGGQHLANLLVHVVSDTFEHAVETFREEYPDAAIHRVERRNFMGRKSVLIDPRVTVGMVPA